MGLEVATHINDLVITNPVGTDDRSTADDHLRLIKAVLKTDFPNIGGVVTASHTELNYVDVTTIGTAQASKAIVTDASNNVAGLNQLTLTTLVATNFTTTNLTASTVTLGGVALSATAAEINTLDGITATVTELNYVDVTAIGTAQASKALVLDAGKAITGITSLTSTTLVGTTGNITTLNSTTLNVTTVTASGTVTGATVNAGTTLQIGGVALTSTAAELNTLDGFTGVVADLNLIAGADALGLTAAEISYLIGVESGIQAQFSAKAPVTNATLLGAPTCTTADAGDNSQRIANTTWVQGEILTGKVPDFVGGTDYTIFAGSGYLFDDVGVYTKHVVRMDSHLQGSIKINVSATRTGTIDTYTIQIWKNGVFVTTLYSGTAASGSWAYDVTGVVDGDYFTIYVTRANDGTDITLTNVSGTTTKPTAMDVKAL